MKNNAITLNKLEKILAESGYVIRYERGNFQSGYCVLEERKVIVLNKFLSVEGRVNTVIELIPKLQVNYDQITLDSQKLYDEVMQNAGISFPGSSNNEPAEGKMF